MADREIVPVLLGADLNCYNVARAFHMKYGVCSEAFGRYAVSATKYSRIVNFHAVKDIDSDEVMLKQLTGLAEARRGSKLVLFGCTDDYAAMIIRNKEALKDYITPYPSVRILDSISKKAEFYEFCEKKGIPYPATVVISEKAEAKVGRRNRKCLSVHRLTLAILPHIPLGRKSDFLNRSVGRSGGLCRLHRGEAPNPIKGCVAAFSLFQLWKFRAKLKI